MRKFRKFLVPLLVIMVTCAVSAVAPASATSASRTNNVSRSGFWVAVTPGESFRTITQDAAASPRKQRIQATIEAMLKRIEQGRVVYIPEGTDDSVVNALANESELRSALSGLRSGTKRSLSDTPHAPLTSTPDSLPPIRGYGCNPAPRYYASWCFAGKSAFVIVGEYCDPEGCTIEDKVTARATVDPAAKTSRVSYSSLYSPNNFDFTQIHFEWWVYCYSSSILCGNGNSNSFPGSSNGLFYPTSNRALNGDKVSHALALWGFFEPLEQWIESGPSRTGMATCEEKPINQCVYD